MRMRTLVVYYSKTGNTKVVAEMIAKAMSADVERLVETQAKRGGLLGYLRSGGDAMRGRKSVIAVPKTRATDYDLIVVGSPVWGWDLAPAVRTYLSEADTATKRVALFCTMGSSGEAKTFRSMKGLLSQAQVIAELAIRQDALKAQAALRARIDEWVETIRSVAD
jgi:flavodoxin